VGYPRKRPPIAHGPATQPLDNGLCSGAHDDFGEIIDPVRDSEQSFNPQPTARNLNEPPRMLRLVQNAGVHARGFGDVFCAVISGFDGAWRY
jgi:hypothetical protein